MSISSLYRSSAPLPSVAAEPKRSEGNIGGEFAKLVENESSRLDTKAPSLPAQPLAGPLAPQGAEHSEAAFTLSQHAENRIRSRGIPWDSAIQNRIADGLRVAESKGSREALILADDLAVIANVRNKTIVTAIEKSQLRDRVFTNIDSAVLV